MANRVLRYDKGIVSVPGPQGEQGEIGPIGPQGAKGDTGDRGPAGPAGATGPRGDTGLRGEPGVAGPAGATGSTGPRGEQGLRGFDGPTGPAGPKGDKGDTGAASTVPGPEGPKGDTGATGPAGAPGVPGQPGSSISDFSYDAGTLRIEMSDGYTWEAFVPAGSGGGSGTPGADGISVDSLAINASGHLIVTFSDGRTQDVGLVKGSDGAAGATGPKGDAGATGPKGDTGNAGANGVGVPAGGTAGQVLRKTDGTDYNTAWATPATGTVTTLSVTTANGVSGTVANATSTPAISLNLGAITPTSVAATGTVTGSNIVRGFNAFCGGKPAANETLFFYRAPYAYTATATNSTADALVAATASAVFTIKKGTTTVGTFTFAAGATVATKAITSGAIAKGDLVTIVAPATPDATLSDISLNVLV